MLGTGGGGPPEVSCLDEKLGRPFGRSGAPPRGTAGIPGSLGGPDGLPPLPKGLGPPEREPGGRTGPRLGPESGNKNQKLFVPLNLMRNFFFTPHIFSYHCLCLWQTSVLASLLQRGLLNQQETHHQNPHPHHHLHHCLHLLLWVLRRKKNYFNA